MGYEEFDCNLKKKSVLARFQIPTPNPAPSLPEALLHILNSESQSGKGKELSQKLYIHLRLDLIYRVCRLPRKYCNFFSLSQNAVLTRGGVAVLARRWQTQHTNCGLFTTRDEIPMARPAAASISPDSESPSPSFLDLDALLLQFPHDVNSRPNSVDVGKRVDKT
jgi:hypothetical protein